MGYVRYTKEILEPFVKNSDSVWDVVRKLGLKEAGGTHANIKKRIKQFNLDISHFLGKSKCGIFTLKSPEEILIKRTKGRTWKKKSVKKSIIRIRY